MKIGLAFLVGGYRATAYSLGTLCYLNTINILDGNNREIKMLRAVDAMSTVSGGSITGMTYMKAQKEGKAFGEYEKDMINFMLKEDLVTKAIDNLVNPEKTTSLIEGIGKVYDEKLFQGQTLDKLMPSEDSSTEHVKYLCVNATDFNVGIPFRFIFQRANKDARKDMTVGNGTNPIEKDKLHLIPLYIPLAASSCFPGGFEPIQVHDKKGDLIPNKNGEAISLMDGGIADNQGIDALLRYDQHSSSKEKNARKYLDLMIVNDVSTAGIESYKPNKDASVPVIGNVKMITLFYLVLIANLMTIAAYFVPVVKNTAWLLTVNTIATTVLSFISIMLLIGRSVVTKLAHASVGKGKIVNLNKLTPNATIVLLKNRVDSLSLLFGSVFMKNLRSKNYAMMYGNGENASRAVNTSIDFFVKEQITLKSKDTKTPTTKEEKFKAPALDLEKHDAIFKIAYQATNMATTLWMPNHILDYNIYKSNLITGKHEDIKSVDIDPTLLLREVITCGQITTCYNIIDKCIYKFNKKSTNPVWPMIYNQAMKHWKAFEKDPYWMYDKKDLPADIAAMDFVPVGAMQLEAEMA